MTSSNYDFVIVGGTSTQNHHSKISPTLHSNTQIQAVHLAALSQPVSPTQPTSPKSYSSRPAATMMIATSESTASGGPLL